MEGEVDGEGEEDETDDEVEMDDLVLIKLPVGLLTVVVMMVPTGEGWVAAVAAMDVDPEPLGFFLGLYL